MRKVINGKRYDTDTATSYGSAYYSNCTDLYFWEETLYQKRTGEFFLYGEGGAASKYAERIGQNNWSGGARIIPLSLESAQKWVEKYLTAEKYEEIFGKTADDETRKALNLSLPVDTIKKLRQNATERGISVSDLICELAEQNI